MRITRSVVWTLLLLSLTAAHARDWPTLRGPNADGTTRSTSPLAEPLGLDLAWKHTIGPGYSGITVAGGRAVTAFSDGTNDVVAAWSVDDGRELWRTSIGETYRGHDGSTDGPVGTATLTDERVYLVGPRGDLFALSVDRGEILWRKNLVSEWEAYVPIYGFAAVPLEVDGVLVVPVGSERHVVVGLDPADGRQLWSLGAGVVDYSTPVLARIGGANQVVVAGGNDLFGIDPSAGRILWTHRHSEERSFDPTFPQVLPLRDRLLLTFQNEAVLYDVGDGPDGVTLTERWRSTALKSTVATPVAVGDHLYGFNGTFLTCVDLETGESVWKSRTPRGRGIIRVDDRLVVLGAGGVLSVGRADPEGWVESASLAVSDHGGYTAPSFAGGRIFVRNLSELASVKLRTTGERAAPSSAVSRHGSRKFLKSLRRIEKAEEPGPLVDAFLAAHESFPIVERDWVHFVYAGPAEAVSVVGQMNDDDIGEPMARIGRADLFVRSYPAVRGGRWQYRFQVDVGEAGVDPRNPRRGSGGFFETSEVLLPGFADPPFVNEAATATGSLETVTVESEAYGEAIDVPIYLPAGFDRNRRYPLIVMPNGEQWTERGGIVAILDRLFETSEREALVALVPMQGWVGGSWGGRAVTLLGEELVPAIESAYLVADGVAHRSLWTVEDKAAVGLTLATQEPQPYGRFAFQSPKLYFRETPDLGALAGGPTAFHVSWSRYELHSRESGAYDRVVAQRLFEQIGKTGLTLQGGEFVAGPGYRTWRTEADAILSFLLSP